MLLSWKPSSIISIINILSLFSDFCSCHATNLFSGNAQFTQIFFRLLSKLTGLWRPELSSRSSPRLFVSCRYTLILPRLSFDHFTYMCLNILTLPRQCHSWKIRPEVSKVDKSRWSEDMTKHIWRWSVDPRIWWLYVGVHLDIHITYMS